MGKDRYMKTIIVAVMLSVGATVVMAKDSNIAKAIERYFDSHMRELSKREAMKELLINADAEVYRCHQVQVSDRVTLVKKKK